MSWLSLTLIFTALLTFVVAQLLLKRAMESTTARGFGQRTFGINLALGTFFMAISFFLTLGLLQRFDLSYLYPFEGLTVIFITTKNQCAHSPELAKKLNAAPVLCASVQSQKPAMNGTDSPYCRLAVAMCFVH